MRFSTLTRGAGLIGALTLSYAQMAQAATGATGEQTPLHLSTSGAAHAASAGSSGSGIVRTIIALIVVIGIIFAISKILKAVKGRDAVRASGNGLEQIATLPIANGKSVSLLRSGTDIILLGVADHGVTAIKTYTEDEAIAAGIDLPEDDDAYDPTEKPLDRIVNGLRRLTVRD
ncbi:MAG TPA: flagellar biosynthetic protein FliO [Solirubrobacteraceae bacterium]|jgi:flagellar protein FliO/FliZ